LTIDLPRQAVTKQYGTPADFFRRWTVAERKQVIIDELREQGVLLEALRDGVGKDMDAFDLICHIVYDQPPLTRRERADQVAGGGMVLPTAEQRAQDVARSLRHSLLSNTTVARITLRCAPDEAALAGPLVARLGPRAHLIADPAVAPGAFTWEEG